MFRMLSGVLFFQMPTPYCVNDFQDACFRMVSCGWDNIRLWRVRNGTLRSCPVDLGEYRSIDFTDVTFEEQSSDSCLGDFTL